MPDASRSPDLTTEHREVADSKSGEPLEPTSDSTNSPTSSTPGQTVPESFGRYRVVGQLGRGGFGVVYRGFDELLRRTVAIKVPRQDRVATPQQAEAYLREARLVAALEHPAIVRVYDCGMLEGGQCYVVSQFIDGACLSDVIGQARGDLAWAVEVTARIAEALHLAHKHRFVHRDVKPSNILLDREQRAYLADFGLAMREEDYGRGSGYAGTPRYMSPEQARGEGHRVDGRSDIYSLGVVFYELLTGQVPFPARDFSELMDQIVTREPPPPRQFEERVPKELERICLKALAKRSSDRYATAADFAEDLRSWLDRGPPNDGAPPGATLYQTPSAGADEVTPQHGLTRDSTGKPAPVVPKSLNAYDARDADFFLELLPGPRDRDGLPAVVRFWKNKLESTDPDEAFNVGLLYGPSGCGKSSLFRAGIAPRLAPHIKTLYVETTADGTEVRLINTLRKFAPNMPSVETAADAVTWLRRHGPFVKCVLVFDQFEQWLFAHGDHAESDLVRALRQCDGVRVQALVMVRDDFWMAATRLFKAIETPLREGHNSGAVDLFDLRHAARVLTAFGRAFGAIGERATPEQDKFVTQAVEGLATDGHVVAVRLALFAEMVKAKPWTPASLKALGGAQGVGVMFLEEAFGPKASPAHRLVAPAAQAVLAALLPPAGTDIKGRMRSQSDLKAAAVNADFAGLMQVLDTELRLVTPTEVEGANEPHYQLTHDFLVPALRDWLGRKQRESRKGRAQLLLAERSDLWNAKPEKRFLPALSEWLRIKWHVPRREWTEPQAKMMGTAGRRHLWRVGFAATNVVVILAFTWWLYGWSMATALVGQLRTASVAQVPLIVREMRGYDRWTRPQLIKWESDPGEDGRRKTNIALARASDNVETLKTYIQPGGPGEVRAAAAQLLIELVINDPSALAEAILGFDRSLLTAVPDLTKQRNELIPPMIEAFNNAKSVAHRATAGAVLFRLGATAEVLPLLRDTDNPELRTQILHRLAPLKVPPLQLAAAVSRENNAGVRRALLTALADYDDSSLSENDRKGVKETAGDIYARCPDAGVNAAAGLLLKKMNVDVKPAQAPLSRERNWYVDAAGQSLSVIRAPGEFAMGPHAGEIKKASVIPFRCRIPRSFAIGQTEVTAGQYKSYLLAKKRAISANLPKDDQLPVEVSWIDAVRYCNWLTTLDPSLGKAECCFKIQTADDGTINVVLVDDYLTKRGYRLPTEAEWEFGCRGGNSGAFSFGDSVDFLTRYGHFDPQGSGRVARFAPNRWGLFDTYGNLREWCLEPYLAEEKPYKRARPGELMQDIEDEKRSLDADFNDLNFAARGGLYYENLTVQEQCSARRFRAPALTMAVGYGFRVCRTLGPDE